MLHYNQPISRFIFHKLKSKAWTKPLCLFAGRIRAGGQCGGSAVLVIDAEPQGRHNLRDMDTRRPAGLLRHNRRTAHRDGRARCDGLRGSTWLVSFFFFFLSSWCSTTASRESGSFKTLMRIVLELLLLIYTNRFGNSSYWFWSGNCDCWKL